MTYLSIYDGSTDYNILDGSDYSLALKGWWPMLAPLSSQLFGGVSPYAEVKEIIKLRVLGSSASNLVDNLLTMAGVIDQADRWRQGDNVNPVLLRASTTSNSADWQCVILGGDNANLLKAAGSVFQDVGHFGSRDSYSVEVTIPIVRRGMWIRNETAEQVTSSSGKSSANLKQVVTFASFSNSAPDDSVICPIDVEFHTETAGGSSAYSNGYLIITSASGHIEIFTPTNGIDNDVLAFTQVAVSSAWDGNVYRCTNSSLIEHIAPFDSPADTDSLYHVFAKWRNPSTVNYTGRLYQSSYRSSVFTVSASGELARFYCPAGKSSPQISYLGVHAIGRNWVKSAIGFKPESLNVANGIELESILIVADDTGSNIVKIDDFGLDEDTNPEPQVVGYQYITIKNNCGAKRYPSVTLSHDTSYEGLDPTVVGDLFLGVRGDAPAAVVYATGVSNSWVTGSGGSGTELNLKITRYRGRRLP